MMNHTRFVSQLVGCALLLTGGAAKAQAPREGVANAPHVSAAEERLLEDRIVVLFTPIDDETAERVIAQLLYLERKDPKQQITLYINSPGGLVSAGLAIYETIQKLKPKVATVCVRKAYSMAAVILASGARGLRFAKPDAQIMIHRPSPGDAAKSERKEKNFAEVSRRVDEILAQATGKSIDRIRRDTTADNFMSAEQARAYGLIDEIVAAKPRP